MFHWLGVFFFPVFLVFFRALCTFCVLLSPAHINSGVRNKQIKFSAKLYKLAFDILTCSGISLE